MRAALFVLTVTGLVAADGTVFDRAWGLYNRTNYAGVIQALKTTQDERELELLGRAYFMNAEFHRATETLEKAAAANPDSSNVQMWLGRAYGRRAEMSFAIAALGFASKARQSLERAVELNPDNTEAVNDLFEFYLEAPGIVGGGLDKAQKLMPLIGKTDPAETHFAAAKLAEAKKEYHTAETHLRRAAEMAPRQAGRFLDLAKFLARRGRYDESEKFFEHAEKVAPDAPKILFARADSYVSSKRNLDQARDLLKRYLAAANLTPDDPPRSEALKLLKRAEGS